MPSPSDDHDRLAWRLTAILLKLNQGERVIPEQLADEFGVHLRTIRRDLHERFAFLPLEKDRDGYRMEAAYLGKLTFTDTERFANLAGLQGLFPALDVQLFCELFDSRIQDTLAIHGHQFENVPARVADFRRLQQAILNHEWQTHGIELLVRNRRSNSIRCFIAALSRFPGDFGCHPQHSFPQAFDYKAKL